MADKISINRLTNANIYVDGNNYLGRAEEVQLPTIKQIMAEHKALGMVGKVEFPAGVDKMEAKIKWNAIYPDVMKKAGNPYRAVQLMVRGSLETYTSAGRSAEVPVVIFMTVQFKDFPFGTFKQHDNVELESALNVTYAKLTIGGQDIAEFDAMSNTYNVDGVDLLGRYRANIGG